MAKGTEMGITLIQEYLSSVPAWYLATSVEGQPHVRPFSFAALEGGRLWFATAKTKDVYQELKTNPRFELTAWKPGSGWIILRGQADLEDTANKRTRHAAWEHLQSLGESYDGPDDPRLTLFSFTQGEAWLCDIDGSWSPIPLEGAFNLREEAHSVSMPPNAPSCDHTTQDPPHQAVGSGSTPPS